MTKWLWIVAGPNGAGKSTLTAKLVANLQSSGVLGSQIELLNADVRTAELRKQFPDRPERELNLQAAQETDAALVKHIAQSTPYIIVETVLSSPKYQDDVLEAKARGYKVGLTYVSVYPLSARIDPWPHQKPRCQRWAQRARSKSLGSVQTFTYKPDMVCPTL